MYAFVIFRDRVTYARRCVAALEAAGLDVVLIDADSAWPPAVEWVESQVGRWERDQLIKMFVNQHPRDLWNDYQPGASIIRRYVGPDERFVVTDCDVVPSGNCPESWLTTLGMLLDENPAAVKAGLGLRTDNLPPWFARRDEVRLWEAKYQVGCARPVLRPGSTLGVWADIDTTLALYRRPGPFRLGPAIRTTAPYEALHLPWYEDTANLPEEIRFYNLRAEHGHWRAPEGFTDHHGLDIH